MTEKVLVYRFKTWDGGADEWRQSKRWGTFDAIVKTKVGVIDRESAVAIDEKHLDENGMTARGFDPRSAVPAGLPNKTD